MNLFSFTNILTATTTTPCAGAGVLHSITVNKAVASGVITVYDGPGATGTVIAKITHPATLLQNQYCLIFDCVFTTSLVIVTGSTDDITVTHRRMSS